MSKEPHWPNFDQDDTYGQSPTQRIPKSILPPAGHQQPSNQQPNPPQVEHNPQNQPEPANLPAAPMQAVTPPLQDGRPQPAQQTSVSSERADSSQASAEPISSSSPTVSSSPPNDNDVKPKRSRRLGLWIAAVIAVIVMVGAAVVVTRWATKVDVNRTT